MTSYRDSKGPARRGQADHQASDLPAALAPALPCPPEEKDKGDTKAGRSGGDPLRLGDAGLGEDSSG